MEAQAAHQDILSENLQALHRFHRDLHGHAVQNWKQRWPGLSPAFARTGAFTLKKVFPDGREVFLHSSGDPVREARSFVQGRFGSGSDAMILGFGLGYHVREALQRIPSGATITVTIVNPDAFWYALEWIPIADLLSDPRLEYIWGSDAEILAKVFQHPIFLNDPDRIYFHKPSLSFAGDESLYLQEFVDQVEAHRAFWATHSERIRRNLEANLETVVRSPGVLKLFDLFAGEPCFVVAPGPSLDDALPELEKAREHGVILSIGAALPTLAQAGIRPHLAIAVDPVEVSAAFHRSGARHVPLVFIPQVTPEVLTLHEGPKFVGLGGNESHGMYSNALLLSKGVLDGQSSVSVYAVDLAIRLGCDPIVFVGLDLSNPDQRGHSSTYPSIGHPAKLSVPQEQLVFHPKAQTVDGKSTFILRNFHRFLRAIERRIQFGPPRRFVNTSRIGVQIKGAQSSPLDQVLLSLSAHSSQDFDARILRAAGRGANPDGPSDRRPRSGAEGGDGS
ncbi:MAG: DUF115 domain-containing protein [Nitrospirae bacterium]|nr:DUF115 domain-containing protein [Nitrospirota bacterium]